MNYSKYILNTNEDFSDFEKQIKLFDIYELVDIVFIIYKELTYLYKNQLDIYIEKNNEFNKLKHSNYYSEELKSDYDNRDYESIEEAIQNLEQIFEEAIYEALYRTMKEPIVFQLLLEKLPFNQNKEGNVFLDFNIFKNYLTTPQRMIDFLDLVENTYKKFNNNSLYTMFESAISQFSPNDLTTISRTITSYMHFNHKNNEKNIITSLVKQNPFSFNDIPKYLQDVVKHIILEKNTINNWENKNIKETSQNMNNSDTPSLFYVYNINQLHVFLDNLFKNHFTKNIESEIFVLESSQNNNSVAHYLAKTLSSSHKIFNNYEILNTLIVIEPDFAKNAPKNFWNDNENTLSLVKKNNAIYYNLPQNIKDDAVFNIDLQCSNIINDSFVKNFEHKKINHKIALDCINKIILSTEELKKKIRDSYSKSKYGQDDKFVIKEFNVYIAIKTMSMLSTQLNTEFLEKEKNKELRISLIESFIFLTQLEKRYKITLEQYSNINLLSIICHFPKEEINNIINSGDCSIIDILESSYASNIGEDKKDYITKILGQNMLDFINSNSAQSNLEFILNNLKSSFFIKKENKLLLTEICDFLSILPLSKLQDSLNNELLENNYSLTDLLNRINVDQSSTPLETILAKVSEIKMFKDQDNNQKNTSKKVIKF